MWLTEGIECPQGEAGAPPGAAVLGPPKCWLGFPLLPAAPRQPQPLQPLAPAQPGPDFASFAHFPQTQELENTPGAKGPGEVGAFLLPAALLLLFLTHTLGLLQGAEPRGASHDAPATPSSS